MTDGEKELPRREQLIRQCDWPTSQQMDEAGVQVDGGESIMLQMGATCCSLLALFLKRRYIAWVALLFAFATLANMKMFKLRSFKDVLMCLVPPVMAIAMGYVGATQAQWK